MEYLDLYEKFEERGKYLLYHYTSLDNIEKIILDGYIKGHLGSVLDDDHGHTISLTRDEKYHDKKHDIDTDCRIVIKGYSLKNNYRVYGIIDRGYESELKRSLIKKGFSDKEAELMSSENQEVVISNKLYLKDYILCIDFFENPGKKLINIMKSKNIAFNILN